MRTSSDASCESDRIAAMTGLLESDNQGNIASLQATIAIIGFVVTYIPVAIVLINEERLPVELSAWLTVPITALVGYQVLLSSSVARRAVSARALEDQLVRISGIEAMSKADRSVFGSAANGQVMEHGEIARQRGPAWTIRAVAAITPYFGFYLVATLFDVYVLHQAYGVENHTMPEWLAFTTPLVLTVTFYLMSAQVLLFAYMPSVDINLALVGPLLLGLLAQVFQREDHQPAWSYFTWLSALLLLLSYCSRPHLAKGRGSLLLLAALGGTVLSGLIFVLLIWPHNGLGQTLLARSAAVLLHAIVPIVAICMATSGKFGSFRHRRVLPTVWWPILYSTVVLLAVKLLGVHSPYLFVTWALTSWVYCVLMIVGFLSAYLLIVRVLKFLAS